MAHSFALLAAGTLMTGLFSVAAQVLVPMAASFAAPGASGRAVGLVMSGLLIGILAARSVAGLLSELGGWDAVYWRSGEHTSEIQSPCNLVCRLLLGKK